MTPKAFVYLAIAAALSVLFAIVSYASNNQWSTGRAAGDKLFPALVSEASQVATIEVKQGDEVAVLERKGGSWSLKSRDGYPADPVKVRTLLVGLAEAELIESKTRRPDRYGVLELEDPAEKGAKSRLVRLLGAQGNVIGEAVIGKKRVEILGTGKGGTYVRKPGDPQTWLANAELDAPLAAKDWVKTSVLTLDASNFSRVTIEIPGEEALKIERETAAPPKKDAKDGKEAKEEPAPAAPGKLKLVGFPPEGKKLKDATAAEIAGPRDRLHRYGGRAQARRNPWRAWRQHGQGRADRRAGPDAAPAQGRRCLLALRHRHGRGRRGEEGCRGDHAAHPGLGVQAALLQVGRHPEEARRPAGSGRLSQTPRCHPGACRRDPSARKCQSKLMSESRAQGPG